MCVHIHVCVYAFVTELCVDYYCVPVAMYHHERSRRKLIALGIKIKLLITTTTQSHSMHVCAIIVYVSYYLRIISYQHVHRILIYCVFFQALIY